MPYDFSKTPKIDHETKKDYSEKDKLFKVFKFKFVSQQDGSYRGTTLSGVYLGYTCWMNKDGLLVLNHKFARPESPDETFDVGQGACVNGSSRLNFKAQDDWKKGMIVKVQFAGEHSFTSKNGEARKTPNYNFWYDAANADLFDPNWATYDPEAASYHVGKIDMQAEEQRLAELKLEAPVDTAAQFSPAPHPTEGAKPAMAYKEPPINYETINIPMPGEPFYTDKEKWKMIDDKAMRALGPQATMADVLRYVTSKTGLPVIDKNYDAILAKLG
jgi:hypothetical protein